MDAQLKVSRAMVRLMSDHPFFGSIALSSNLHRDDDQPTMCTNGQWIKWNAGFVDRHPENEVLGVIAHEVLHIVLKHMLRRGDRDHERWNIAADYAINGILNASRIDLPSSALLDPKYTGMTAEKIYDLLPDDHAPAPEWGGVEDMEPEDQTPEQAEMELDQKIKVAGEMAKSAGKMPSSMQGVIDDINRPDVDLDDVLRRFVGGEQPDDYSYRRPNKKLYHSARMIAPTMDRFGVGNILLAVDTSGSMSDKELTHCLGVINAISEEMSPSSIRVVCCDMTINSVRDYEAGEAIMDITPNGRGGTLVRPVFDHVEDEQLDISQMIYLTDLEVWDYPDHAPEYPVMWVSTQAGITPPFGEVTVISVK